MSRKVLEAGVLHIPENLSDHSPIYCKIDIDLKRGQMNRNALKTTKLNWKKTTQQQRDEINHNIKERLNSIETPAYIDCRNVHCRNKDHIYVQLSLICTPF